MSSVRPGTVTALTLALLFQTACGLSRADHRLIDAWLNCDECINGERPLVAAMGERVVPTLIEALRRGPSRARDSLMVRRYRAAFPRGTVGITADQYAAQLLDAYRANYRKRAAISLGDIASPEARAALRVVYTNPDSVAVRTDLVSVAHDALVVAGGHGRFVGSLSPTVVAFGDTVTVLPPTGVTFNSDAQVQLGGLVTGSADLVVFRAPDRLRFLGVSGSGHHLVTISSTGPSGSIFYEITGLTISSLTDPNDRLMRACATLTCQINAAPTFAPPAIPHRAFLSLGNTPSLRDSIDVVKVSTGATPRPTTATLGWDARSGADLDVRWVTCAPPHGTVPGARTVSTGTTEVSMLNLPARTCVALLVVLRPSRAAVQAFAQLTLTAP